MDGQDGRIKLRDGRIRSGRGAEEITESGLDTESIGYRGTVLPGHDEVIKGGEDSSKRPAKKRKGLTNSCSSRSCNCMFP